MTEGKNDVQISGQDTQNDQSNLAEIRDKKHEDSQMKTHDDQELKDGAREKQEDKETGKRPSQGQASLLDKMKQELQQH